MAIKTSAKPAHRLEVKYRRNMNPERRGWIGVRYDGGHGCEIITVDNGGRIRVFGDPITAAWECLIADENLSLYVDRTVKDGLEVRFEIDSEYWGVQVPAGVA